MQQQSQAPSRPLDDAVRGVLAEHARLKVDPTGLAVDDDLVAAGLTSHASVTVMLALEDAFDVEFTPDLLTKATFSSVGAISAALTQLGVEPDAQPVL